MVSSAGATDVKLMVYSLHSYFACSGVCVGVTGCCAFSDCGDTIVVPPVDMIGGAIVPGVAPGVFAAPGAAFVACAGPIDLIYAISICNCSSLTCPWNDGITGWNPATTFASGLSTDSRI